MQINIHSNSKLILDLHNTIHQTGDVSLDKALNILSG